MTYDQIKHHNANAVKAAIEKYGGSCRLVDLLIGPHALKHSNEGTVYEAVGHYAKVTGKKVGHLSRLTRLTA